MENWRMKLMQFLRGRYLFVAGQDIFSRELVYISLGLIVLSWIFAFLGLWVIDKIFYAAALASLIYSTYRLFSRDIAARQSENRRYLFYRNKVVHFFSEHWQRFRNRKEYAYFSCPKCKTTLRVPRGKGNITISCRNCSAKFDAKT